MRVARLHFPSLLRALFAASLTLALLSGALPLAALSKAAHVCSMPCCAGGVCATGACEGALFKKPKQIEEDEMCGAAHKPKADASEDAEHCHAGKKENPPAQATTASDERRARVITARALYAPCAKDCCAGGSTATQSRRGRDATVLTLSGENISPPVVSLSFSSQQLRPASSAHLKRLRARAPPFSNSSNPA